MAQTGKTRHVVTTSDAPADPESSDGTSSTPAAGAPRNSANSVTLKFQSILRVRSEAARSQTFRAPDGGIQLRVGSVWLDTASDEPLETEASPATEFRVLLWRVGDSSVPDTGVGRAQVAVDG